MQLWYILLSFRYICRIYFVLGNIMSYIRAGHDRNYFIGKTSMYVHSSGMPKDEDYYIEDYKDKYEDNCDLIEMLANIIQRETLNESFTTKMVKILAKKLNVENMLREQYK